MMRVEVESKDMVETVRDKIHEKEGIPTHEQVLVFAGKHQEDKTKVRDHGI